MRLTKFNETILNEDDIVAAIYSGKDIHFEDLVFDDANLANQFNSAVAENADHIAKVKEYLETGVDLETFDKDNQRNWFIPEGKVHENLVEMLYGMCETEEQTNRVSEELQLYIQHGMLDLLFYLKYLVDTLRENNIVWGVGRGSSVASYCLYLIGVHKIDSIKYKLDIKEFLK